MKKLLASAFAFALVMSMNAAAFAVEASSDDDMSIPVSGTYQEGASAAEVVYVDVTWDDMNFTYTAPSKGTWNPKTHEYENAATGGWAPTNGADPKITVTNHSNVGVKTTFAFQSEIDGLNGSFTENTLTLATAEGTAVAAAPKGETAFSVSGSAIDANKDLGTITVTVAQEAGSDTPGGITTFEALQEAVNEGGTVTLGADITISGDSKLSLPYGKEIVLDLNNHTLSGEGINVIYNEGTATIKNGTVSGTNKAIYNVTTLTAENLTVNSTGNSTSGYAVENHGQAVLTNCTLHSNNAAALYMNRSTVKLVDCALTTNWKLQYTVQFYSNETDMCVLTISGTTTIDSYIVNDGGTNPSKIVVESGCSFDPMQHYSSGRETITDNGDGTYTLQKNQ